MLLWWFAHAVAAPPPCDPPDEPAVFLITVQPEPEVITLFGHTALLFWDPEQGDYSSVYDYGRFRLEGSVVDIVSDYLTMQQEYFVGSNPLRRSTTRYRRDGRGMVAQRLALTPEEARELELAIVRDVTEDPTFQYNWYDQNCSTKIRDHLDRAVGGTLKPQMQGPSGTSPAAEVLRHSADHPLWAGLTWGSTRYARQEIPDWDAMFLPEPLMTRIGEATRADGQPLVADTCQWIPDGQPPVRAAAPSRTLPLFVAGLLLAAGLAGTLRASRSAGLAAIAGYALLAAGWGTAALIVGVAGTFAPFWGHDNLAFASPLWFLGVAAAIGAWRNDADWAAAIGVGLLAVALLGVVGSLVFGFAAGNLGLALLLVPPTAVVAWGLGADRWVPQRWITDPN